MKLVFDCTALSNWVGHATGIQRVVSEVGTELIRCLQSAQLGIFLEDGSCREYCIDSRTIEDVITLMEGDLVISAGSNWDYPEHNKMLLSLRNEGVRLGLLFYDVIPVLLPFSYGPGFSLIYDRWLRESLAKCDIAFSISENTRRDIMAYAKSNEFEVSAVHTLRLGDEITSSKDEPSVVICEKAAERFILSVGTLEYRKNHVVLLNAYRYMVQDLSYMPPKLYLVGKRGWLDHDIEYQVANDPRLQGRIEILQGLSDADLQHLYENCLFTVYPSFYEGWGLPIAESLCFGKPCIASSTSSMGEIAPGLVRHAHPLLMTEWVEQIRDLADNPEKLKSETSKVKTGYQRSGWSQTAQQMRLAVVEHYPELLAIEP
jgi:glycosyltransferase involved in cell wall biosynthesis